MIRGSGNTGRINKDEPAAAATVTALDNGLTLVGTTGELGGANALIHNTALNMGLFDFVIRDQNNFVFLELNEVLLSATLGDPAGVASFRADMVNGFAMAGDTFSTGNATILFVDDATNSVSAQSGGGNMLVLDNANFNYFLGDVGGLQNGTAMLITDSTQTAQFSSAGFSMLFLDMATGIFQLGASGGGTVNITYLQIDDPNQQITTASGGGTNGLLIDLSALNLGVRLGDIQPLGFGNEFSINDGNGLFICQDTAGRALQLDTQQQIYDIGDLDNVNTGVQMTLNSNTQLITMSDSAIQLFFINFGSQSVQLGDSLGTGNSTLINVNDAGSQIRADAAGGMGINQVPTLSPFAVAALQAFANDAAAVVGGLGTGDFYRISVAGTSTVAVVE